MMRVRATSTVLATGGVGALFEATTNPAGATGDGIVLAWEAGAGLADLEFVQFHPTALAIGTGQQRVLVTEALRGAGAHVVDADGRRFLFDHHSDGELAPRDVVARAIAARGGAWLDGRHLDRELWDKEFPTVAAGCRANEIEPSKDLIPVAPAAHYFIGGVQTDLDGRTTIPRLYAVGECSNTGVHGANRLAGNSLAEALVFGRRASRAIAGQRTGKPKDAAGDLSTTDTDVDVAAGWGRLRALCSAAMGIERRADELARLPLELETLARTPLTSDRGVVELRSGAILARLMARAALLRTESRGVHHRADFPDPAPDWAGVRLRIALTDFP
jgi:L-aspartate oxidase